MVRGLAQAGCDGVDLVHCGSALGLDADVPYSVRDELTGETYRWYGPHNFVILDPSRTPGHILCVAA